MSNFNNPKIILVDPYLGGIPGLGLAYLASYARQKLGLDRIIILQKRFYPDLAGAIIREDPDLVGYFSLTVGQKYIGELINAVATQRPRAIQVMGGPHITALPETILPQADLGVIGEGEETFAELIKIFQAYGELPASELIKTPGLVFRDQGQLVKTAPRTPVADLDTLPKPARDLLDIKAFYPARLRAFPTKNYRSSCLMTTRGCPFRCIFCQEGVYGPRFRYHGAERVVEEMEELVKVYHCNYIEIQDDQFLCHKQRLREIVQGIKSKGLEKKAAFYCYLRANQFDEEVAQLLKQMNTKLVFIGFESGSDRVLKYLKDSTCSVEANQRACDLCRKYGIYIYGAFIFGSPSETMSDLEDTYRFIKRNPMALCEASTLTPLPGTGIWDYALSKGIVSPTMDFERLKVRVRENDLNKIWLAEKISVAEFLGFYQKKIKPLIWRYSQKADGFSLSDLFKIEFIKNFAKTPKFYLSVFKQTVKSFLYD